MKKDETSNFLEKFKGRIERIGKTGILGLMTQTGEPINNNSLNNNFNNNNQIFIPQYNNYSNSQNVIFNNQFPYYQNLNNYYQDNNNPFFYYQNQGVNISSNNYSNTFLYKSLTLNSEFEKNQNENLNIYKQKTLKNYNNKLNLDNKLKRKKLSNYGENIIKNDTEIIKKQQIINNYKNNNNNKSEWKRNNTYTNNKEQDYYY